MQETKKSSLIFKTLISFAITFLIILIVTILIRSVTLNMKNTQNSFAVLANDYFDVIATKFDSVFSMFKIKRNSVSQYQVNLVSQSIEDYIGMVKFQNAKAAENFNTETSLTETDIQKFKEVYYKMTLENPYLRSLTFFDTEGNMRLNLFSQRGFTTELNDNLIKEVKAKKSVVLHAQSENAFYIIQHVANSNGDIIVASRNDYMFIPDIVAYYQINQKDFILRDNHNVTYKIQGGKEVALDKASKENAASVISKYAYYKTQSAFTVDNVPSLSVTMTEKVYPNYFELALIFITALLIVLAQRTVVFIIALIKKRSQKHTEEYKYDDNNVYEERKYEKKYMPAIEEIYDSSEYQTKEVNIKESAAEEKHAPIYASKSITEEKNTLSNIDNNKTESEVKKYGSSTTGDFFSSFDNLLVSVISDGMKSSDVLKKTDGGIIKSKEDEDEKDIAKKDKKFKFQIDEI